MNTKEVKAELQSTIGSMLTKVSDSLVNTTADFGSFFCSVENYEQFTIVRRTFETAGTSIHIPFSCSEPCLQMIFSLDGHSVFNNRFSPFLLSPVSHCINFFRSYECANILSERSRQHDITIRLKKSFYSDLVMNHLAASEDRLPTMILHENEFNTINEHIPADPGILGLLKNITECPFQGEMKTLYLKEHLRALFNLQVYHFNPIVTGKAVQYAHKLTKRDQDILQDVKQHLNDHFLDPSSLETISKHFGINEFKLKHGFKVLFNTSPMRYLQLKRLEYGKFLLKETDKTIKEISDELGYTHPANFTTAFTKTFGNPPSARR